MHRRRTALLGVLVATAALALSAPATAAAPKLSCRIAGALTHVPARPVWFPVPQPGDTTLTIDAGALPKYTHGLKWSVDTRYLWLARLPRGGALTRPNGKRIFNARFDNLGRSIDVLRLADGRAFAQWKTTGRGPDTTVVVARNITSTELGEFIASLRKVQYATGC